MKTIYRFVCVFSLLALVGVSPVLVGTAYVRLRDPGPPVSIRWPEYLRVQHIPVYSNAAAGDLFSAIRQALEQLDQQRWLSRQEPKPSEPEPLSTATEFGLKFQLELEPSQEPVKNITLTPEMVTATLSNGPMSRTFTIYRFQDDDGKWWTFDESGEIITDTIGCERVRGWHEQ